jgi:ribosomal protein S12 methylthiotransferase accessory factor
MTTMLVSFPGGKRVNAEFDGFALTTDQPRTSGGAGSAPSPFDLFLASIATCAGFYAKGYCDTRGLPTEGLALTMHVEHEPAAQKVGRLVIEIALPAGFPEKHREGVVRAAELCAVKKHIQDPPTFEIHAVSRSLATAGCV